MEVEKWLKSDDPALRCDFTISTGAQCGNKAVPGVTRCPLHGANMQVKQAENRSIRMYRLAKFAQRKFEDKAGHDKLKTLHEEVALLKMLIEEKINACDDMTDLLLTSGPITEMVMKVQKLVESCDRLDHKAGNYLDRQKIQNLASGLMQVVADKINEFAEAQGLAPENVTALLSAIADAFLEVLQNE